MSKDCNLYREWTPKSVLAELSDEQQKELDGHLSECAGCSEEFGLYCGTIRQLKSLGDADIPRHFFVYPEEKSTTPWRLFRLMSPAWQAGIASCILLAGTLSIFAATGIHVRAGNGGLMFAFGNLHEPVAPPPAIDLPRLEERIAKIVEEKNRKDSLEWVRALRSEIAQSQKGLTQKQRATLETALASLENRMGNRIEATARTLEERNDRSVTNLYQTLSRQRERDLTSVDTKLSKIALSGEIKDNQTDAILETLLQVAELRLK